MVRGPHVREMFEYEIISEPPSRVYIVWLASYQYMGLEVLEKENILLLAFSVLRDMNVLNHVLLQTAVFG